MNIDILKSEHYDSVFAKRGTRQTGGVLYDEFVVYRTSQALPKYIVHYQESLIDLKLYLNSTVFKKHVLSPKRGLNASNPLELHFRIVESQFLRLCQVSGVKCAITTVDYYVNPTLSERFCKMAQEMRLKYPEKEEAEEILAFHGTCADNIESIMKENFKLEKLAANTKNRGRYGAGIYFSEFPSVSMGYGGTNKKLILCKILPGKSWKKVSR